MFPFEDVIMILVYLSQTYYRQISFYQILFSHAFYEMHQEKLTQDEFTYVDQDAIEDKTTSQATRLFV